MSSVFRCDVCFRAQAAEVAFVYVAEGSSPAGGFVGASRTRLAAPRGTPAQATSTKPACAGCTPRKNIRCTLYMLRDGIIPIQYAILLHITITQEVTMQSTSIPRLTAMRQEIDTAPDCFGWLTSSIELLGDPAALQEQMAREGYVYLPGALHRDEVLAARREIAAQLADEGYVDRRFPIDELVALEGIGITFKPELTRNSPQLARVLYDGPMMAIRRAAAGRRGAPLRLYLAADGRAGPGDAAAYGYRLYGARHQAALHRLDAAWRYPAGAGWTASA